MRLISKKLRDASMPFPTEITSKTVECTHKEARRFRGSMRVYTGKIFKSDEFEARRKQMLNTELP